MNKIVRISKFFQIFFLLTLIGLPILDIMGWLYAPNPVITMNGMIQMSVIPKAYIEGMHPSVFTAASRWGGFIVSLAPLLVQLYIVAALIKLFQLYAQGEIFSLKNVRQYRRIGYGLLISQIIAPINEALLGPILTWQNPPGHRFATISFGSDNICILVIGLMVILISWIMTEGQKLQEEQQLTV